MPTARRHLSQTEETYRKLKRGILDNALPPGSQWLETELAGKFGVSRTPVREAMIRLVNEGLIEVRPRHGMHVLPVSRRDIQEIYELIAELEPLAARLLAARGASDAQLASMAKALTDMEAALDEEDLRTWAAADERFHEIMLRACGNRRLAAAVSNFWDQGHRVQMLTLRARAKPYDSTREHRALLEAIRERDPEKARRIHRAHRERVNAMLLKLLDSIGFGET